METRRARVRTTFLPLSLGTKRSTLRSKKKYATKRRTVKIIEILRRLRNFPTRRRVYTLSHYAKPLSGVIDALTEEKENDDGVGASNF